ncbi:MAG: AI-2E family transporter [Anaeromicrobium sp.]|jgi:predicted PurR-regulated permease PerM|uniref:AI-2E family transporter n=1 Tax=Anaeromicrobium sp. TaxID=1929132 RepID=UPI0025CD27A1|nr:AI-2E family transporter [Anaeromicrobium sp.]MCT4595377.1 AI-2E family transporter [Anaeromicrobium sp.]
MINRYREFIEKYLIVIIGLIILGILYKNVDNIKAISVKFFGILTPFIIGIIIAYLLNPLIEIMCSKLNMKRGMSILGVYTLFFIGLISLFTVLIPTVVKSSIEIVNNVPTETEDMYKYLKKITTPYMRDMILNGLEQIKGKIPLFITSIFNNIGNLFQSFTSFIITISMSIIISIYATMDKDNLIKLAKDVMYTILGKDRSHKTIDVLDNCNKIFKKFLGGISLEASIIGIIAIVGFFLMGIKYATLLGIIIGITNIIPYVGPFIGATPALLVTLFYSPIKALQVGIFILILQQFDANLLNPKIMGNVVGLSPVWILFALAVGGGYFGILGMILAVPIAAIIKIFLIPLIKEFE